MNLRCFWLTCAADRLLGLWTRGAARRVSDRAKVLANINVCFPELNRANIRE